MFSLSSNLSYFDSAYTSYPCYKNLLANRYTILFHYDEDVEGIVYEAILKEAVPGNYLPNYLSITILANGNLKDDFKKEDTNDEVDGKDCLFLFIVQKDKALAKSNPKALEKIYAPIQKEIEPLFKLSQEDIDRRIEEREDFLHFASSFIKDRSSFSQLPITIKVSFSFEEDLAFLNGTIKIGRDKFYSANLERLKTQVANDEFVYYGTHLSFKANLSAFDEPSRKLFDILGMYATSDWSDSFAIAGPDLYYFLSSLINQTIFLNGENFLVSPVLLSPSFSIDSEGELSFNPSFDGCMATSAGHYIVFDMGEKKIQFLSDEDEALNSAFYYLYNHKDVSFKTISDIFCRKIYPSIKRKVAIDENYKEEHRLYELEISLFVDIGDAGQLVLASKMKLGTEDISERQVLESPALAHKYREYSNLLTRFGYGPNYTSQDEEKISSFLHSDLSFLDNYCTIYLSDKLKNATSLSSSLIQIETQSELDWFSLSLHSDLYSTEELHEFLKAYQNKKKYYILNGHIIWLNDKDLATIISLEKELGLDDEWKNKMPIYDIFKLPLSETSSQISLDKKVISIIDDIKNFEKASYEPKETLNKVMRPYQLAAFKWLLTLRNHGLSGILADDMGLGKSLEVISFIESLPEKDPILIVCPKSLVFNWEAEWKKWYPSQEVVLIDGSKSLRESLIKKMDTHKLIVYVSSYDSVRNDSSFYQNITFSLCVLDEGQYIKNSLAMKSKAVKTIKAKTRLVLTGTPIENSILDLWSIFDFLMPGYLLSNSSFKKEYSNHIGGEDKEAEKKLLAKVRPFVLRRNKSDVLKDLPKKTTENRLIEMTSTQRKVYEAYLRESQKMMKDSSSSPIKALAALTRLRQDRKSVV